MSLRNKAIKGVAWNSFGTIGAGIVSLIITMLLARMLTPRDFGILELLVIFSVISDVFVDSGFSQAVIRDNRATDKDLTSVFYTNLIIAVSIYALLFISAPLIADFFNEPSLIDLSRVVFLTIIFNSLSIIQNANFSRNVNFRSPAIASFIAMILAGSIAVTLAFKGFGVWALAANLVLFSFFKMFLLWVQSRWRPSGWIKVESLKKYLSFGSNLLIQSLVDKIVTNLESLLIGKIYTKSALGYFSQGRKLDSYITQTSTGVIQRVTYPVLSKLGDDKIRLKEGYRQVIGMTMLLMIPLMFGVIASADNLIIVAFGAQWEPSIPYLQLWALVGLSVSLYSFFTNIFLVLGKSKELLRLSLIRQTVRLIAIILFIRISIMSMMWSIVIVTFLSSMLYIYYGGKLINYSIKELVSDLWQIIFASFISAIIIYIIGVALHGSMNMYLVFLLQTITMLLIYTLILKLLNNTHYISAMEMIKKLLNKKK